MSLVDCRGFSAVEKQKNQSCSLMIVGFWDLGHPESRFFIFWLGGIGARMLSLSINPFFTHLGIIRQS